MPSSVYRCAPFTPGVVPPSNSPGDELPSPQLIVAPLKVQLSMFATRPLKEICSVELMSTPLAAAPAIAGQTINPTSTAHPQAIAATTSPKRPRFIPPDLGCE